jgi:hypothetical protein
MEQVAFVIGDMVHFVCLLKVTIQLEFQEKLINYMFIIILNSQEYPFSFAVVGSLHCGCLLPHALLLPIIQLFELVSFFRSIRFCIKVIESMSNQHIILAIIALKNNNCLYPWSQVHEKS